KEKSIRITSSSGLSKEDVEKMRKDAEVHSEEDKQKRETVTLKNDVDNAVYRTEKLLKEQGEAVGEKDRTRISAIIDRLKSARDKDDAAGMKKTLSELEEASQEIGKAIYEKAARGGGSAPGGSPGGGSATGSSDDEPSGDRKKGKKE